jgi:mono/diheme cytochrome c family protein
VLPKIDNRSFFKLKYETLRALFGMRIWQCITTVCFLWAVSGFSAAQVPVDFAKDVLPVLSDNCFNCHGPDAATREGGLRLDVQERAFGEGDSGAPPIVSGDPNASEILARMLSDDPDVVMPPPDQVKRPTPEQIQRIKTWIQQGAHWQSHWAFDRPSRPNLPEVSDPAWNQNPIDRFVLDKLQQQKLAPSSMANRAASNQKVAMCSP